MGNRQAESAQHKFAARRSPNLATAVPHHLRADFFQHGKQGADFHGLAAMSSVFDTWWGNFAFLTAGHRLPDFDTTIRNGCGAFSQTR
jgi:hypothetical protein